MVRGHVPEHPSQPATAVIRPHRDELAEHRLRRSVKILVAALPQLQRTGRVAPDRSQDRGERRQRLHAPFGARNDVTIEFWGECAAC